MMYFKYELSIFVFLFFSFSSYSQKAKVNTDQTKIRGCDMKNCIVLGRLPKGKILDIVSIGKRENIDGYGVHPWIKVKAKDQTTGFIFGALLDILNDPSKEIKLDTTGYIRQENVNVRTIPNLSGSEVLFQEKKGVFCKILSQTKVKENIDGLGTHPWYFIEVKKRRGYVFGGLLSLESNQLTIDSSKVKVYDKPNGNYINMVAKGDQFTIITKGAKSELIRPFGRNYWYKISENNKSLGWIYGIYTSKSRSNVDCQCVDYVKNVLSITGPTKNAFEWNEVLEGIIPVTINGKENFLDYQEIVDPSKVQKHDIVIFDIRHPEADNNFGHIAIVNEKIKKNPHGADRVPVIGGNQKVPFGNYFIDNGCTNVSYMTYLLDENVRFFRKKNKK